jgi:hypothetical protein
MSPKRTSARVASRASHVLADQNASDADRSAAASALVQRKLQLEETSRRVASEASAIVRDPNSTAAERSAAASALAQRGG